MDLTKTETIQKMPDTNDFNKQIEIISRLFSNEHLRKEYLALVVKNLKVWVGCECVGIRVINEIGVMPYEAFVGFTYEFWEQENLLSLKEHQCGCTRVVTGSPVSLDLPIMTPNGSLWTNDLQGFGKTIPAECYNLYRGKCIETGYCSLAVIPIKYENKVIAVIHLADRFKDKLPLDKISTIESVSGIIGENLARFS